MRELREKTGAGILDCKNALVECAGNMEEAIVYLRQKGLADAQKRRGRSTEIGRIFIAHNDTRAAIVELLCETDFVARNDRFVEVGNDVASAFIDLPSDEEREVRANARISQGVSIIKENITLNRHQVISLQSNQHVSSYIHGEDGSLGALVIAQTEGNTPVDTAALDELLHDIAMHISARRPQHLTAQHVPEEYRAQQLTIFTEQAKSSGKPAHVVEKIAAGKLQKHLRDICLLEQGFVKEEKQSVQQILAQKGKQLQQQIEITQYVCYKAGEAAG